MPARRAFSSTERLDFWGPFSYHAGADGLTVLFVLLAALVAFLVSLYGHAVRQPEPARLVAVVLAVESAMISLLVTFNLLWFMLLRQSNSPSWTTCFRG